MSKETDAIWEYLKTLNLDAEGGGGLSWEDVYPIGTIYQTEKSPQEFDPNTAWGGTWIQLHGRFLVAEGNNSSSGDDALNLNAGDTGGKTNAIVPYHRHGVSITSGSGSSHTHSLSSHTHEPNNSTHFLYRNSESGTQTRSAVGTSGSAYTWRGTTAAGFGSGEKTSGPSNNTSGSESAHTHSVSGNTNYEPSSDNRTKANLPPYLAVYMWKRTA